MHQPEKPAPDLEQWGADMRRLVRLFQDGFQAVHGFEPDEHLVRTATAQEAAEASVLLAEAGAHRTLLAYYARMSAVELPDLENGIWIEDVPTLLHDRDHPTRLKGAVEDTVTGFATDGGGGHYAVSATTGSVYHMTAGALYTDATYPDGLSDVAEAGFSIAAPDLWTFLDQLRTELGEAVDVQTSWAARHPHSGSE
ncbi:hypothetical protein [Streptomyces melanogenes]|uniref:hypothetical protein n=1 Tax=Streptomyces melanogenes TaxID=67326 RepID=UPI00167EDAFB|nr:hypothetical protein [Streptomyces melanogenes]GGP76111.1 hypothetical protein GCM10010278_63180 [Streptomyces melanogenes]